MTSISLCMIVRDDEKNLTRCLDSVRSVTDEIIIVDLGSTDKTKEIARQYTDDVFDFEWSYDFSAARNFSFSKASKDYILWLDADEWLAEPSLAMLLRLKSTLNKYDILRCKHITKSSGNKFAYSARVFKRSLNPVWSRPVNEICTALGAKPTLSDLTIYCEKTPEKIETEKNIMFQIFDKMYENDKMFLGKETLIYARELYEKQRYDTAAKLFELCFDPKEPDQNAECAAKLFDIYTKLADRQNSLKSFSRLFDYGLITGSACCEMGKYLFEREQYDQAAVWFKLLLAQNNQEPGQLYTAAMYLSNVHKIREQWQQAYDCNETAGLYLPQDSEYLKNRQELSEKLADTKLTIPVCLACDGKFAPYTAVTMASVLKNKHPNDNIRFYILDGGITDENKEKILALKDISDCEIEFAKIDPAMFEKFYLNPLLHLATPIYYRLNIPQMLANEDKVVYLDSDVIVLTSLRRLYQTDISCHPLAAAKESTYPRTTVNTGVIVINTKMWREQNITSQLFDWLNANHNNQASLGDQSAINAVLEGRIKILNDHWNDQTRNPVTGWQGAHPSIVHYNGKIKPWHYENLPGDELWHAHDPFKHSPEDTSVTNNSNTPISVILPVYNAAPYLDKCLSAFIDQTFKDFEVICVDDGSTDDSLKILNEYAEKDPRFVVLTGENLGPARARNKGLRQAAGKYIMFCDADDSYKAQMIERMHSTLIQEDVDLVICEQTYSTESTNQTFLNVISAEHTGLTLTHTGKYVLNETRILELTPNCMLWNKIFKKSIIDKYNIGFPSGYLSDDNVFVCQYLYCIQSYYGLKEKLYARNYVEGSVSFELKLTTDLKSIKDHAYIPIHVFWFLVKNRLHNDFFDSICKMVDANFFYTVQLCAKDSEKKEILRRFVLNEFRKISSDSLLNEQNQQKLDGLIAKLADTELSSYVNTA